MKILLKNANILTMERDEIQYGVDLLTDGGKIAAIGRRLPAEDASVIPCTGKFLIPGLFDAHCHIDSSEMGELFIANGITSVRSLNGNPRQLEWAEEIEAGLRTGPYIYSSGAIYDGVVLDTHKTNKCIATEEEAEQAVRDTINGGYRWMKTYPAVKPEVLEHLMKTANRSGIKVCGHMSYHVDAKVLADWGYFCCEHSSSLPRHPSDIEYIAKAGMWFCPTQVVCETLPDYVWNGKQLEELEHYQYVPKSRRDMWTERNKGIIRSYKDRGLKPDINVIIARGKKFMEFSDRYMAGSDTCYPGMIAGFSLHDELGRLVDLYGRTNYQALRAATVNPSLHIGIEGKKGTLVAGKDADIVILADNPLADIRNTRKIEAVMQAGKLYDRAGLDAMLGRVRNIGPDELEIIM